MFIFPRNANLVQPIDYYQSTASTIANTYGEWTSLAILADIGVARIFDWGGAQTLKNLDVFTEIESDFWAGIGNSNVFSAQNQVVSKKKRKKKRKRSSPQLNNVRLCCHNFLSFKYCNPGPLGPFPGYANACRAVNW